LSTASKACCASTSHDCQSEGSALSAARDIVPRGRTMEVGRFHKRELVEGREAPRAQLISKTIHSAFL
jgi:hypothetical protein